MLFQQKPMKSGVTQDHLHRLRNDIPTRWKSHLSAILIYITELDNITEVGEELKINADELSPISTVQIKSKSLQRSKLYWLKFDPLQGSWNADWKLKMSRTPRILVRTAPDTACNGWKDVANFAKLLNEYYADRYCRHSKHLIDGKLVASVAIYCRPCRALQTEGHISCRATDQTCSTEVCDCDLLNTHVSPRNSLGPGYNWCCNLAPRKWFRNALEIRVLRRSLLFNIVAIIDANEFASVCVSSHVGIQKLGIYRG